jgi:site-specific DNA-methyltransferase (adenine-specific)
MGSGTTGAVCAYNARAFIGVELDKEYFNIASKRIKIAEENYQPPLF